MAERVGFEPTAHCCVTGFQDQLLKPLGHLSELLGCEVYIIIPEKFCQVFCANSVYSGAFVGILFSLFSAVQILTVLCRTENRKAKPQNRLGLVSANSIL